MSGFLRGAKPPLVLMVQSRTPEDAIALMRRGIGEGAEAFGVQVCKLLPEHRTEGAYRRIFAAADGLPLYVTNYRHHTNEGKTDAQLAEELVQLADCGGELIDVMGDYFDPQPGELTTDPKAVEQQLRLIERIHAHGAEVLMSSHLKAYYPPERVIAVAKAQQSRGADIAKIVNDDTTAEEAAENLRLCALLKTELEIPYLFLSGKRSMVLRRVGPMLGACCWLCRLGDEESATKAQPILRRVKAIRDNFEYYEEDAT
ncbi:MAG: type I 3-dehydroquinate dehydratase [Oscillospiraceae bacterium]|nr:type I 3-dehydroquinate dehydratase [Oscillospiraceae bacterium]